MINILSNLPNADANIVLNIKLSDLMAFSNELINRAKTELNAIVDEAKNDRLLTKDEVKQLCNVCDATLWHWGKKDYLKPVKVGNKLRYRSSDVQKILGDKLQKL